LQGFKTYDDAFRLPYSIDQIPEELIKAGGTTIRCEIHKFIISIWDKEELSEEWKESIMVPIYKKADKTAACQFC
jgi:hypothetical protein